MDRDKIKETLGSIVDNMTEHLDSEKTCPWLALEIGRLSALHWFMCHESATSDSQAKGEGEEE